jgi:hypothetical protein
MARGSWPGRATKLSLPYGSDRVATVSRAAGEGIRRADGIELIHLPYDGAGPAVVAVAAHQVDRGIVLAAVANPQRRRCTILARGSAPRFPLVPELPTPTEMGLPVVAHSWIGQFAAPGTLPASPRTSMPRPPWCSAAISPGCCGTNGFSPLGCRPARCAACVAEEQIRWTKVVREARIAIEG